MYQFLRAAMFFGCLRWLAMFSVLVMGLSLAWGANSPEPLAGHKWAAQASGARHALGVDAAGQVWAWGDNSSGQLGLGHTRPTAEATQVNGLPGPALAVSAGSQHSAALLANGTVWVWGANNRGQLGRNPIELFTVQSTPVQVAGLTNVVGLSGGNDFVLALKGSPGKAKKGAKKTVLRWGAGDAQPSPVTGLKVQVAEIKPTKAIPASPEKPIQTAAPVRVVPSTVRPELVEGLRQAQPERVMAQPSASSTPSSSTPSSSTPSSSTPSSSTPVVAPPPAAPVNVSGVVRLSSGFAGGASSAGEALANVQVSADGAQCTPTDGQGRYVCAVPSGWSGRIRVSRNNYQFSPSSLSFSNLRFDAGQQNFAAIYDPR